MKRGIVGAALAVGLASGIAGNSSTLKEELQLQQTPLDAAESAYAVAREYWGAKNVGLAAIRFVVLESGDSFECNYGHRSVRAEGEDNITFYCPDPDAIVTTQKALDSPEIAFPGQGDDAARFMAYHEYGHGVHFHTSGKTPSAFMKAYEQDPIPFELMATRYAGQAAGATLSISGQVDIQRYLNINPDQQDWAHGSQGAHYDAFTQGLHE